MKKEQYFPKIYRDYLSTQECERAQEMIPLEKDNSQFLRFYKGTIGYTASVGIMPATLVLDLILLGRCRYGCSAETREKDWLEFLFPTTSYTYEHTKEFRCPDNSYYINKFLEVAECYERRNDKISLEKSISQLNFLSEQYHSTPTCIQIRDGQIIDHVKERVAKKINLK